MHHVITSGGNDHYETMLEALDVARVLRVSKINGRFGLMEGCDEFFSVDLSSEQLALLGNEFIALAKSNCPPDAQAQPPTASGSPAPPSASG